MAGLDEEDRNESFFFGTHPKLEDREKNFTRMNARNETPVGGDLGVERFAEGILPVLAINGELEMKAGRWDAARDQLWRYRLGNPNDPKGRWLIGETERRAGPKGDPEEARKLLEEALALDPEFSQAHRSLGLLFRQEKNWKEAAHHLTLFLDLEPDAVDGAYLEAYLEQCLTELAPPPSS
jgi:tetratricopeptide (TPR) repeat protein